MITTQLLKAYRQTAIIAYLDIRPEPGSISNVPCMNISATSVQVGSSEVLFDTSVDGISFFINLDV